MHENTNCKKYTSLNSQRTTDGCLPAFICPMGSNPKAPIEGKYLGILDLPRAHEHRWDILLQIPVPNQRTRIKGLHIRAMEPCSCHARSDIRTTRQKLLNAISSPMFVVQVQTGSENVLPRKRGAAAWTRGWPMTSR
jgi:hypothetical protein